MKKPVVSDRNESSINAVLALDAVRLYHVKIIASNFRKAGEYRFDRKLAIPIDHSDIFTSARIESSAHVPSHSPLFRFSQHPYTQQPCGKSLAYLRGSIAGARPKVRNQDQFPFEAKQGHYLVKIFHKWDNLCFRTITKDCDGKFDG